MLEISWVDGHTWNFDDLMKGEAMHIQDPKRQAAALRARELQGPS